MAVNETKDPPSLIMRTLAGAIVALVVAIGGLVWNAIELSYSAGRTAEQVAQLRNDDIYHESQISSLRGQVQEYQVTQSVQLGQIQQTLSDMRAVQTRNEPRTR